MEGFIIIIGVLSMLGFCINFMEKNRITNGGSPYPTWAMALLGVIAPFGSLMGMLICANRLKCKLLIILVPLMLIALVLGTYLLRG